VTEKTEKSSQRRDAEKRFEEAGRRKIQGLNIEAKHEGTIPGPLEGVPN
jgi:hypothetical protein